MNKILNIVGPQGCGKSTLAQTIAEFIGGTINSTALHNMDRKFAPWMSGSPSVVIVEVEQAVMQSELGLLKAFAASTVVEVHHKGDTSLMLPAPRFIVCSEQPIADADDRRVLLIGGAA